MRVCKKCNVNDNTITNAYWFTDDLCSDCVPEEKKLVKPLDGTNEENNYSKLDTD